MSNFLCHWCVAHCNSNSVHLKTYDYEKIYASMLKPAFLFDGRNLLNHAELVRIGFEVHAIGVTMGNTPMAKKVAHRL